ncbi:MAG: BamA/TamA family outer membrane protein [Calditrichia bacterium]|nr:BamA/TamA family outer membrane protein [Calditrichia bacterium]
MNKYLLSKLLIFLLFVSTVLTDNIVAQANDPGRISQIVIMGNEVTDENVILRELLVKKGEIANDTLIAESKKRLQNLLLFNRVELTLLPQENNFILLIEVTERLYIYPLPIFTLHDRDWEKISYGLSLSHLNFRGQNEKLRTALWFGYRSGYAVSYSDQWAGDSLHFTTYFNIGKYVLDHRILGFEERHIASSAAVGKWWNYNFKTELLLLFDHLNVDDVIADSLHSKKSSEDIWGLRLYLRYDTRDLYAYPSSGWLNFLQITKYGILQEFNNYWKLYLDVRNYLDLGFFTLATRLNQNYLFGQIPIYRSNYIGFSERIRGHFFDVYQGNHVHTGSIELRFPILPVQYFSFDSIIIPDAYLRNLKFGINAGFFVDTGIIWSKSYEYSINNFHTGFGAGLHFRIPYVEVLRLDYGFNRDFEGQIIFEIGNSF